MANYYCLMAGLPDLSIDNAQPGYDMDLLREQCEETLSDRDKKLMFFFFLQYDCANLVKLLKDPEADVDSYGNYTREQYIDLITSAREMNFNVHRYPSFLSIFAREYDYNKDKQGFFAEDEMTLQYLEYCIKECSSKMMRRWYSLILDITNILTAMLARKQGWNVSDFIKGEGEVQTMIRENQTKDFNLSHEYDYMKQLMQIVDEDDPVKKERMIDAFKWEWLDEHTFFEPFSIEAVFAYFCKLSLQYRWSVLDIEQGKAKFEQIIDDLRGEARVPEEFTVHSVYDKSEGNYQK